MTAARALLPTLLLGAAVTACTTLPTYTGTVVVTGSDPHVHLVLVTDHASYEIVGDLKADLWQRQQQTVSVQGTVVRDAAAPGFPAQLEVRRILVE